MIKLTQLDLARNLQSHDGRFAGFASAASTTGERTARVATPGLASFSTSRRAVNLREARFVAKRIGVQNAKFGGLDQALSGLTSTAMWLDSESLLKLTRGAGYQHVQVIHNNPDHADRHGVGMGARAENHCRSF